MKKSKKRLQLGIDMSSSILFDKNENEIGAFIFSKLKEAMNNELRDKKKNIDTDVPCKIVLVVETK